MDGRIVPLPHMGVIVPAPEWHRLSTRLQRSGIAFKIKPTVRFPGQAGQHHTMFFEDPFGTAIEIKGFEDLRQVFA